ncbi:HNH endonuclease [Gemmata sp. JC673]|uniref:HNH endonuclease n=1 Tax=Gemmata algarum TaxID=2975278 RepID=A0ABU5F1V1_9BACT|nr:HNH endonuclease [Gemmata algarum]MDY3561305.1 HNH endonuclease [Gemmata algarum]
MSLLTPFAYPTAAHAHKHAPAGYTEYQAYKPWLRDEFVFRCVYCLKRETWGSSVSGHAELGADHFEPQSLNEELAATYTNLIYACNDCNSYRRAEPLPINPLTTPLADHLVVDDRGKITGKTTAGQDFIDLFDLDAPGRDRLRADRLAVLRAKQSHPDDPDIDAIYRRAFGYPAVLPDLTALKPPAGNGKEGSETDSCHARRLRNEPPDVYQSSYYNNPFP